MTTLREATKADCGTILEMIRELAQFEKLEHLVTADVATLERNLFATPARAFALVAEADGLAAGFCLYFFNFSTFLGRPGLYIEDIYIRPEFRSRGVGKEFFARLGEIARQNSCGRMEWWVLDWNTRARQFYEQMGAEAMSEWIVYRLSEDKLAGLSRKEAA